MGAGASVRIASTLTSNRHPSVVADRLTSPHSFPWQSVPEGFRVIRVGFEVPANMER
jgi:hypothetical protein